jgi:hypothetical protein
MMTEDKCEQAKCEIRAIYIVFVAEGEVWKSSKQCGNHLTSCLSQYLDKSEEVVVRRLRRLVHGSVSV